MMLRFLVPNNAWAFVFGDSLVRILDNDMFYCRRLQAIEAAERAGLRVSATGAVSVAE